ncbi:MAG: hypothetical protein ACC656_01125 [Candidatus Heimdallarchaeota archaeon]
MSAYNQEATFWTTTPDGYGGFIFSEPEHIMVRWEDKSELFIDSSGEQVVSNVVVYAQRDMEVGDVLVLGITDIADPGTIPASRRIRKFQKIPSLNGFEFNRKVLL